MKLEDVTISSEPRSRRYADACATAHALDLVGERWALLVMRELMLGPKRFGDLRAGLPGLSANVLTQRLEGLELAGILRRTRLPPPASVPAYELTPWGYESAPIFTALGRWAARSPSHDPTLPFSAASLLLSFRAMLAPERAAGLSATLGLRLGRETYLVELADGEISVGRAREDEIAATDAVLTGAPEMVAATVYGGVPLAALELGGSLAITGDRRLVERFIGLFPLPPKASATDALPVP